MAPELLQPRTKGFFSTKEFESTAQEIKGKVKEKGGQLTDTELGAEGTRKKIARKVSSWVVSSTSAIPMAPS